MRIVDGGDDLGVGDVLVHADRLEARAEVGRAVVLDGQDIAAVAQEWAGLQGRVVVTRRDGRTVVLDHGVLPGRELFAAVVAAAGGPNTVRSD